MSILLEAGLAILALSLMWATGVRAEVSMQPRDLAFGVVVGVALAFLAIVIVLLPLGLLEQLRRDVDFVVALFAESPVAHLVLISLFAGVCEELFFRGFVQTWLQESVGVHVAVAVAAALFGLAHAISRSYVLFAFMLGAALGYLYAVTGSLPAVMAAHAAYDLAALVFGMRVLGTRSPSG
jgi:membrane protease YdiL (CAAX protease family)